VRTNDVATAVMEVTARLLNGDADVHNALSQLGLSAMPADHHSPNPFPRVTQTRSSEGFRARPTRAMPRES